MKYKGTFLLGAGAQKAGTTWLQAYLNSRPGCEMGYIKEYHVWDGLTVPEMVHFDARGRRFPWRARVRSAFRQALYDQPDRLVVRQRMQNDPTRYFDYFEAFLERPGVVLTGDFTPNYSGLGTGTLIRIRDGFLRRGIRPRAVFVMRDPLDRALSAIRMYHRDGRGGRETKGVFEGVDMARDPNAALLPYLDSTDWRLRGDYPAILERLESVFLSEDLYVGFYETMFSQAEFARLNAFFGTEPDTTFQQQRFNATRQAAPLPPDIRARAAERLAPVYEAVFARWPQMRTHWYTPSDAM
ncbi:hypothetical protein [Sagittula stellata]|uniref:hypothetical protein n=1 Tax=Sagittula stellata TaxID=52603 RepID=UPI00321C366A